VQLRLPFRERTSAQLRAQAAQIRVEAQASTGDDAATLSRPAQRYEALAAVLDEASLRKS
jgi:hypothetical protein